MTTSEKPFVAILLGTAREGRLSLAVAQYVFEAFKNDAPFTVELFDIRHFLTNHTIPPWEPSDETRAWRDVVARAAGFIIVTPEYNHGYPGELKMLLDHDHDGYRGKPVLTVGVSEGAFGGARMIEHILPVYNDLGLVHVPYPLYFPVVGDFAKKTDEEREGDYKKKIDRSMGKLALYLEHLRGLNEKLVAK